jgi:hypothetical protein
MSEQWHLRVDDEELIASVRHEQLKYGGTRNNVVVSLVQDGLVYRRAMRDADALRAYSAQQQDVPEAGEKDHDQQA